jgi:Fe2+ or Zn2+ uptake regulation protein
MQAVDERLSDALHGTGHRVTSQRLVIHRELRERGRHATVEQVHAAVAERLPGVSLPTVYATLELLEELGLARRVHPGRGPVLFDPRTDAHAHAVCRVCGRVEDVEAPAALDAPVAAARRAGFAETRGEVVVTGLCADCAPRARA